jgi:hypothetical protein
VLGLLGDLGLGARTAAVGRLAIAGAISQGAGNFVQGFGTGITHGYGISNSLKLGGISARAGLITGAITGPLGPVAGRLGVAAFGQTAGRYVGGALLGTITGLVSEGASYGVNTVFGRPYSFSGTNLIAGIALGAASARLGAHGSSEVLEGEAFRENEIAQLERKIAALKEAEVSATEPPTERYIRVQEEPSAKLVNEGAWEYRGRIFRFVDTPLGRFGFYKRTGTGYQSSEGAQANDWAPFLGVSGADPYIGNERISGIERFQKVNLEGSGDLRGYGYAELLDVGRWLESQPLPPQVQRLRFGNQVNQLFLQHGAELSPEVLRPSPLPDLQTATTTGSGAEILPADNSDRMSAIASALWQGILSGRGSFEPTVILAQLPAGALGNLVSIADPDRVSFQKLELWDSSGGSALAGQFVVNGAPQGGGREIDVTPADVANTFFNVGSLGGSDLLWAQLVESDGQLSGWKSFTVSAPPARLPSFSVSSPLAARGDTIALSDLVKISDPDSIGFQALHLWDSNGTVGGGRFVVNGMPQTGGHVIDVSPSDFASTVFKVGTLGGTDQLWVQLLQVNGELSSWTPFTVTAPAAQLPSVAVQDDRSATAGESIPLSRLVTVVDPQNVGFQSLQLWDSNGTSAGGQFVIGNSPQTGGHIIEVAPADLANTVFHAGTLGATDQLWAQIVQSNGQASGWKPFNIEVADNGVTTLDATFTSSGGVKSVAFKLDYDPELVTVADAELGADLPDTARVAFRNVTTEDGAEAYITVTSEEPIAAGRVNIASVSITPRHSGRHLDGIRKLHVHDVNGKLFAKPEKVRIRIDDVARTSSEMSGTEQDIDVLDRYSERDSSAPKIRVKIPAPEASTDNASSESILTEDPAQDWADLRMPVRIAIGELPATDTDLVSKDLRHSRRWNLDWSTNGSATNFPEKVRIPFASLAKGADPSPNP